MKKFFLILLTVGLFMVLSPLSALASDMNITFGWNANPETDIAKYEVYSAATVDGAKTKVLDINVPGLQGTATLPEGHYFFFLQAVDVGGHPSGFTAPIEQTLDAPPSVPTGFVILEVTISIKAQPAPAPQ